MTASHLIAVNCHEFHKAEDIACCLASVAVAVGHFGSHIGDPIQVRVYWHNADAPAQTMRERVAESGFELIHAPRLSNGENLNRQIDDAVRDGFDIFFRVDGDDTVTQQRFVQQSELLTSGSCDLCGGGLLYMPPDAPDYVMQPGERPGPRDFVENQFVLHPSMGFRLDAFRRIGLRYWSRRLEDKALLLRASKAGLRIGNVAMLAGSYNVDPSARNLLMQKWLNLRLNFEFLIHSKAFRYIPYAFMLFALHVVFGSDRLRQIRHAVRHRKAPPVADAASAGKPGKPVTS